MVTSRLGLNNLKVYLKFIDILLVIYNTGSNFACRTVLNEISTISFVMFRHRLWECLYEFNNFAHLWSIFCEKVQLSFTHLLSTFWFKRFINILHNAPHGGTLFIFLCWLYFGALFKTSYKTTHDFDSYFNLNFNQLIPTHHLSDHG